jgi:hypothetical protein
VDETVNKNKLFPEIIGWYGVLALLTAYALVSFGTVSSSGIIYQLLNLTGALGIVVASLVKRAYQPAVLNIIWMFIAFIALLKIIVGI